MADGGEGFLVAVTGMASFPRRARAAACSPRSEAAALARVSWVAVSQAHASWMTSRGDPDRDGGLADPLRSSPRSSPAARPPR